MESDHETVELIESTMKLRVILQSEKMKIADGLKHHEKVEPWLYLWLHSS